MLAANSMPLSATANGRKIDVNSHASLLLQAGSLIPDE